jgi:acetyl esterase/lipase
MKGLMIALVLLSVAGTALTWYPIPSETYWPIGAVARELWPWLLAGNLLGVVVASRRSRVALTVFLVGAAVATWPLVALDSMKRDFARQWRQQGFAPAALAAPGIREVLGNAFGGYDVVTMPPEVLALRTHFYRPATRSREPRPILITIHGGSWQNNSASSNDELSHHFAGEGWAVFSVEYRLAPTHRYPAQIEDVRAAIEWIYDHAGELGADGSRIALSGRSAGGHLAMLAGYTSERVPIRAVVSFYAPADLAATYYQPPRPDPERVQEKIAALLGGAPHEVPDAYRDASPASYVRSTVPPTLLIQGRRDNIVEPRLPREFHEQLLESGARALLLELPWSDHSFDIVNFGPGSTVAFGYMESFLRAAVGEPSGSPVLAAAPTP